MRMIKDKRSFFTGLLAAVLAIGCFAILCFSGFEWRICIVGVIALLWACVSFSISFTNQSSTKMLEKATDERDKYIAMKSAQATLKIINYLCSAFCFICLVLYGIFKNATFIVVAVVLCSVLLTLFITMLFTSMYYEKHD